MNIYVLADDPVDAARMLCDAHVFKTQADAARMLGTVWSWFVSFRPYPVPPAPLEHPCMRWLMGSAENYEWLAAHAYAVCVEYVQRFDRQAPQAGTIAQLLRVPYGLRDRPKRATVRPQVMPAAYRVPGDAVAAYRAFYIGAVLVRASWTNREPPRWLPRNYQR